MCEFVDGDPVWFEDCEWVSSALIISIGRFIYIKKQHLHTRGAETNDRRQGRSPVRRHDLRGEAQYGGTHVSQRGRQQQQRAQPGQAAEATGQAQA